MLCTSFSAATVQHGWAGHRRCLCGTASTWKFNHGNPHKNGLAESPPSWKKTHAKKSQILSKEHQKHFETFETVKLSDAMACVIQTHPGSRRSQGVTRWIEWYRFWSQKALVSREIARNMDILGWQGNIEKGNPWMRCLTKRSRVLLVAYYGPYKPWHFESQLLMSMVWHLWKDKDVTLISSLSYLSTRLQNIYIVNQVSQAAVLCSHSKCCHLEQPQKEVANQANQPAPLLSLRVQKANLTS